MPIPRKIVGDSVALIDDMVNHLTVKIMEKELKEKITMQAFQKAQRRLADEWNRYIKGDLAAAEYNTPEKITRMPGHPVDGTTLAVASSAKNTFELRKFAGRYPAAKRGTVGLERYSYRMFSVAELDFLTSDDVSIPYWSLFEWGSGIKMSGQDQPPWVHNQYPRRRGMGSTSQAKGYQGYWVWYPKEGIGDRGRGAIIGSSKRPKTEKTETLQDFPPGHMFYKAAGTFISEFVEQARRSGY